MQHAVVEYLHDLHQALGHGVPETSGYPALSKLLNAVGDSLKPKIAAVIHPANSGSGIPDGGLFNAKELKRRHDSAKPLFDLKPERGVIEVKPLDTNLADFENSEQVLKYLQHYGQVLLTNYRCFALWSWKNGQPVRGEHFELAKDEDGFWDVWDSVSGNAQQIVVDRLWQFLRRALLSTARIATPEDLAAFLASYAREARARVSLAPIANLEPIKKALSESLGVHFDDEKGGHFFRSTLVQTLFYGIFSAWVLWHESKPAPAARFQWRLSAQHLGLPILRTLFVQLAGDPKKVRSLNLEEVLDWTEECLARVDRPSFFARYDMGEAVQYFYEPFLAEFDPELRKSFGVWYTPPEIVRYMVGSVDQALRDNFNLPDGLADPSVIVLDPCCGTGAYLVETLRLIYRRLVEGYGEAQAALKIREVAKKRLYGFELLPAPYVVSHLQIDLLLNRWGADLKHDEDERAGVFLTNALTGWVPVKHPKDQVLFSEFSDERDASDQVKQKEDILVIIGNPPYDGYAGLSVEEERNLSEAYRATKEAPAPQGQGLNDLYIRFYRMAERRIAEGVPKTDDAAPGPPRADAQGIVCFISNYSWLDGLSHPGMRERFLEVFDSIRVDCLNGDKYKTGKKAPDGSPDPSVFSTEANREGIQVGTAIALLERRPPGKGKTKGGGPPPDLVSRGAGRGQPASVDTKTFTPRAELLFRHWWGKDKREDLEATLEKPVKWQKLKPALKFSLPFVPMDVRSDYEEWKLLPDLLPTSFPGVKTSRDNDLVDIDFVGLKRRMDSYFNPDSSGRQLEKTVPLLVKNGSGFDAKATRETLLKQGIKSGKFMPYLYRPMDTRWIYWHSDQTKLLDRSRPEYVAHCDGKNPWLFTTARTRKNIIEPPLVTKTVADLNLLDSGARGFPLYLSNNSSDSQNFEVREPTLFGDEAPSGPQPNLTDFAKRYLAGVKGEPEDLFFHIVAVLHAPLYREENGGALRQDWPRIPLPTTAKTLRAGAALGRQLAALLDPETPVPGVTDLKPRADLKGLGELAVAPVPGETRKQPEADLALTAKWGSAGQGGVVMPGKGKTAPGSRGAGFLDIHLNATTRWKDVPEPVWAYTLGGYQVLKKWLSYREKDLLGRPLTSDEAHHFTHTVRRIAAILALRDELNTHYQESV